jgi:error-prone DNA polymerase
VVADYQTIRLSLKGHPMEFLRATFTEEGIVSCATVAHENDKRRVRCAGIVLVRQRPGSSKGVVFMTLEDETGIANIVVWPKVMEKFRKEVMGARLVEIEGTIQSSLDHVVHLVADRLFDRTPDLIGLSNDALRSYLPVENSSDGQRLISPASAKARHPREVRILPASRDFH